MWSVVIRFVLSYSNRSFKLDIQRFRASEVHDGGSLLLAFVVISRTSELPNIIFGCLKTAESQECTQQDFYFFLFSRFNTRLVFFPARFVYQNLSNGASCSRDRSSLHSYFIYHVLKDKSKFSKKSQASYWLTILQKSLKQHWSFRKRFPTLLMHYYSLISLCTKKRHGSQRFLNRILKIKYLHRFGMSSCSAQPVSVSVWNMFCHGLEYHIDIYLSLSCSVLELHLFFRFF